jgi:hypothetical protein
MPKLNRWILAKKDCPAFSGELAKQLADLGANLGGGRFEICQVINVNAMNREKVIALLRQNGFTITDADEEGGHLRQSP